MSVVIFVGGEVFGFMLLNIMGGEILLSDFEGKKVVLEWINYDCFYVIKYYSINNM